MTDKKLLKAAAKAAGYKCAWSDSRQGFYFGLGTYTPEYWNPLANDGDALRLAVKLKIPLQFPDWQDIARTWGPTDDGEGFFEPALEHNGDLATAVRRAIVRAAASIASQNAGEEGA